MTYFFARVVSRNKIMGGTRVLTKDGCTSAWCTVNEKTKITVAALTKRIMTMILNSQYRMSF